MSKPYKIEYEQQVRNKIQEYIAELKEQASSLKKEQAEVTLRIACLTVFLENKQILPILNDLDEIRGVK